MSERKVFGGVIYRPEQEKSVWIGEGRIEIEIIDRENKYDAAVEATIGNVEDAKLLVKDLQAMIRYVEFTPKCDQCGGRANLIHTKYGIICAKCRDEMYGNCFQG